MGRILACRGKTAKLLRPCNGRAITRRLAKDVDAIVLTAIRYEPEASYFSVNALAADLSKALTGAPLSAREGNLRYRAGKFCRRRTAILGTAAVLVVLAIGLAEVAHQGRIASADPPRRSSPILYSKAILIN